METDCIVSHATRRLPLLTCAICLAALALEGLPALAGLAEYDRAAVVRGELWRLVTGHAAHWNFDHLLWDMVMFATLGSLIEGRSRWQFVGLLAVATAAISSWLWFCQPEVTHYRGLSGLDSALFAALALHLLFSAQTHLQRTIAGLLVAALVGKIGYELASGVTLFVDSSAFVPLAGAHAVGAAAGFAAALAAWWLEQARTGSPDDSSCYNPRSLLLESNRHD